MHVRCVKLLKAIPSSDRMALLFYTHYMRAETMKVIMFDIAYKAITATFLDVCGLNVVIIDILPAAAVTPAFI